MISYQRKIKTTDWATLPCSNMLGVFKVLSTGMNCMTTWYELLLPPLLASHMRMPVWYFIDPRSITNPRWGSYRNWFESNSSVMSLPLCLKVISTSGSVGRQGMTLSEPWVVIQWCHELSGQQSLHLSFQNSYSQKQMYNV